MKRLIFIFLIILIVFYFQYTNINNLNNDFTILQYNNPSKDILEKMLFEKKITILTGIQFDKITYNDNPVMYITPKIYSKLNSDQHTKILKSLKQFFDYYYLPMSIKSDISINYEKRTTKTRLIKQNNYRFCVAQFLGTRKLYLFPPSSEEFLYPDSTGGYSIDFWNQNTKTYPDIAKAKYIEIILHHGMAIFIPYKWIYCYEIIDNSMSASFYSESVFSSILKK